MACLGPDADCRADNRGSPAIQPSLRQGHFHDLQFPHNGDLLVEAVCRAIRHTFLARLRQIGIRGPRPPKLIVGAFTLYFLAVLVSVHNATFGATAFSYPFQLIKMGLVILAATKVAFTEEGERAILAGFALGLIVQLIYAVVQKAGGALQTGGALGHQNLLGFVTHLTLIPLFAAVLAGRMRVLGLVGVGAGVIIVALTASRATLVISGLGLSLALMISIMFRFSGRKMGIAAFSFILVSVALPLAILNLQQRFQAQNTTFGAEDQVREAFERAARMMIDERPGGIGPNHYVFIANTEGFSNRARVDWSPVNRSAIVHNAYLLQTAESGYLGLITMVALLGSAIFLAFKTARKYRRTGTSETLIGIGCGLIAISIHSFYEWVFFVATSQYLFAISLGMIGGIAARQRTVTTHLRASKVPH
jgi:O-antigen ligase